MKKHIIFLSAVIMAASSLTGCNDKTNRTSSQESQPETTEAATEPTTKPLIEIDPFKGLYFLYHHTTDGDIEELSNVYSFNKPVEASVFKQKKKVQFLSKTMVEGITKCKNHNCKISIFRDVLDPDLKKGDKVLYHVVLDDIDLSEEEIPYYLEMVYGIKLTRTQMAMDVKYKEAPIVRIDPFENDNVWFSREADHFKVNENLEGHQPAKDMKENGLNIRYEMSLVEGNDLNDLYAGDKIKISVVLKDKGKEYKGDELTEYLRNSWKRVRLTRTEKEYDVLIYKTDGNYSSNVNVSFARSDDWHEIVSDKNKFSKYDLRRIDGSTATIPITAELVRQFCGIEDSYIRNYVDHNTTGPAYEKLIQKQDNKTLLFVTEPSEEELAMAAEYNVELDVTPVALDGFVFLVNKDNPVDSLTVEQIQDIYSGKITNWSEVGGNDEEIIAYQREPNSGSQTVMENMVMNGVEMMEPPKTSIMREMGGLVEAVATYKNSSSSIGYSFYYYLNNLYKNEDIKVLKINGVTPDNENLLDNSYPFSSGYYAVTLKGGDPKAEEIKQYLLTDEGQELIKLAGYCPVR